MVWFDGILQIWGAGYFISLVVNIGLSHMNLWEFCFLLYEFSYSKKWSTISTSVT